MMKAQVELGAYKADCHLQESADSCHWSHFSSCHACMLYDGHAHEWLCLLLGDCLTCAECYLLASRPSKFQDSCIVATAIVGIQVMSRDADSQLQVSLYSFGMYDSSDVWATGKPNQRHTGYVHEGQCQLQELLCSSWMLLAAKAFALRHKTYTLTITTVVTLPSAVKPGSV